MRDPMPFHFMHWAKSWVGKLPYCLGASGVPSPAEGELLLPPPEAPTENYFGERPLRAAIASAHGVDLDHVLVSEGASLANYTALSVLAGPDDRILVESPTYAILEQIPRFHRAEVVRFPRRPEDGWLPRLEEIRAAADAPGRPAAAVVLTRLHNPSGADLDRGFLDGLAAFAAERRIPVLLDEVYLDFVAGAVPGHTLSPWFVSTGSLTKAYGYGGLRVGWVIGAAELLRPIREFSFYLAVDGSFESQTRGARVVEHRDVVLARSRAIAERGRRIVEEWVRGRGDVSWTPPAGGITAMLRFERLTSTRELAERLRAAHGVNLAEGEFFGMPGWGRISFGREEAVLREALRRLGSALDEAAGGARTA